MPPRSLRATFLVLAFAAALVGVRHFSANGDDLASSYVGCRLLSSGQAAHLYDHDPLLFNVVSSPSWVRIASAAKIGLSDRLHPYVQTPLWAYLLQPLCTQMGFRPFNAIFASLLAVSWAGVIGITALAWCPRLRGPGWIALICLASLVAEPMKYAEVLTQTHLIFVLMTLGALLLARGRHPIWAGLLLAAAATVKITPVFLLLYWLLTRRWKAAAACMAFLVALAGLTLLLEGPSLTLAYLHELRRLSDVLLVSLNNQSFAAWWLGPQADSAELLRWHILPLPPLARTVSLLLLLATTTLGGLLDRSTPDDEQPRPPYGGIFALVAATVFTPIAWTHYFVVLILPLMLLLDAVLRYRSAWLAALTGVIYLLNVYPFTPHIFMGQLSRLSLVRPQFYAGVLSLAALAYLANRHSRSTPTQDLRTL